MLFNIKDTTVHHSKELSGGDIIIEETETDHSKVLNTETNYNNKDKNNNTNSSISKKGFIKRNLQIDIPTTEYNKNPNILDDLKESDKSKPIIIEDLTSNNDDGGDSDMIRLDN